jgi:hypothetical protein
LALSSIQGSLIRSILTVVSFAVGTALILLAVSIPPAVQARRERERMMLPEVLEEDVRRPPSYTLLVHLPSEFLDRTMVLDGISSVGSNPPLPPGLEVAPQSGTSVVSPSLAELLKSPNGYLLRPRIPGELQVMERRELPSPDALVAYVGLPREEMKQPDVVVRFGPDYTNSGDPISLGVWIAVVLLLLFILAPIVTVLITATRLSSRTREARLAALRLIGAPPSLVRAAAAIENSLLALIGAVLGVPLFFLARTFVAQLFPDPYRWFPSDLTLSRVWILAIVLGITAFAAAVSISAMRRVALTPLGVLRRSTVKKERPIGLWLIGGGGAQLVLAVLLVRIELQSLAMVFVALGLVSLTLGVIVALPWLVRRVATALGRRVQRPALVLATHTLRGDPGTFGRAASAVAVIVLVGAIGQAVVLASGSGSETVALRRAESEPATVFVTAQARKSLIRELLLRVESVHSVESRRTDLWGGIGLQNFAVRTDGSFGAKEAVRNALAFDTRFLSVQASDDLRRRVLGPWYSVRGLVEGMVAIALLVVWSSGLVAAVDRTMEQKGAIATLSVIGTRTGLLRAAFLYQTLLPLALSVALGWALSVPIATALFSAVSADLILPIRFTIWLIMVLTALIIATSALTIPWIRGVAGVEALRAE